MIDSATLIASLEDAGTLDELAAAIAPRITDALAPQLARALQTEFPAVQPEPQSEEWITASETARRFHMSAATIYAHADELGARRLGDGPKARLRFHPPTVAQALTSRPDGKGSTDPKPPTPAARPRGAQRQRETPGAKRVPLIPIRGRPVVR
jgi:hypothetical protein